MGKMLGQNKKGSYVGNGNYAAPCGEPGVHEYCDVKKELSMPSFSHCDLKTTLVLNYLHHLETVGFDTYRIQIRPFEVVIAAADSYTVHFRTL